MIKKILTMLLAVTAFVGFNACEIPSSVEVRINPNAKLPIGRDNGDLSSLLTGFLDDALSSANEDDTDVKIVTYKGYTIKDGKGKDKDVQTFLIKYKMADQSMDFSEGLEDFTSMLDNFGDFNLKFGNLETIKLDEMGTVSAGGAKPVDVNIEDMLTNTKSTFETEIGKSVAGSTPLAVGVGGVATPNAKISLDKIEGFDAIAFKEGVLDIVFSITPNNNNQPSAFIGTVDFQFSKVMISDGTNEIVGTSNGNSNIRFFNINSTTINPVTVNFSLSGKTLKNEFWIELELPILDSSSDPNYLHLHIDSPVVNAPVIRGVDGYEIKPGEEITSNFSKYEIDLTFDDSFIHAEVGKGKIEFEAVFPEQPAVYPPDRTNSWIKLGDNYRTEVYMLQDYTSLHGEPIWKGLSDATGNAGNYLNSWKYVKGNGDLKGKHFNTNPIVVDSSSKFILTAGKVSFNLSDTDIINHSIGVSLTPNIQIDEFSVLNLIAGDLLKITKPDPIKLNEAAEYLKSIKFDKVGVELIFGEIGVDGMSVMIKEPTLQINTAGTYQPIASNTRKEFTNTNHTLNIRDNAGNIIVDKLQFEVDVKHNNTGNPEVLEMKNVDLTKGTIKFDIDYKFYFKDNWTNAVVDMSDMNQEDSIPIDGISSITENLSGFKFDHIKSYLYIEGHPTFFNMNPDIRLKVKYGEDDGPALYTGDKLAFEKLSIPDIGDDDEVILKNFDHGMQIYVYRILNNPPPGDMSIDYSINLSSMDITPKDLEDLTGAGESNFDLAVIIVLPLSIEAGENGASFIIPEVVSEDSEGGDESDESGSDDLFGRTGEDGEFSVTEMIKKLSLKISLNNEIFSGGTFYMRRADETAENANLRFSLKGKSMNVAITGKMLDVINKTIPYKIEEMGIVFEPGTKMVIPSDLKVRNISFDFDIAYVLDLEF